jgi:hypothetical protein
MVATRLGVAWCGVEASEGRENKKKKNRGESVFRASM